MQRVSVFNQQIGIVPRWIIFLFDIAVAAVAFVFAYGLAHAFDLDAFAKPLFARAMLYSLGVTAVSFLVFRLYSGIVRYTSAIDSIRILTTLLFNLAVLFAADLVLMALKIPSLLSAHLTVVYSLFAFTGLTIYRTLIKIFFQYFRTIGINRKNVVVYGAGELGIAVKRTFDHDPKSDKFIVAYLDDGDKKISKVIDGVRIFHSGELERLIRKMAVDELIIASRNIDPGRRDAVIDSCLLHGVTVLTLPPVSEIINGNLSPRQIKQVRIEDLLEREPVRLDHANISGELAGKRVLVTGAAGSIGSEIARQLARFAPQLIILCDQAESPLHDLHLSLQDKFRNQTYHPFIADVRDEGRMRTLFETLRPEYVYHAAAYKHVPMMESHPAEAVRTNVFGTFTMANLSVEFGVAKFVLVSTDKAVNPTNVMGATKRIAETYVQALNRQVADQTDRNGGEGSGTEFVTTRFGNVLGSNGSVIPRFREQIEKGGPLTVTHPDIVRYFMTIPEACQLVIEAGSMGNGGEIFVFDMGRPVKIVDLAEKMVRLSGLMPYKDISITFTGLRPGEKLYEELLGDLENSMPTHHQKILIAKVRESDFETVSEQVRQLFGIIRTGDSMAIVRQMKRIVPEFKSQNSVYEQLDGEGC